MRRRMIWVVALGLLAALAVSAGELQGVSLPDRITAGGSELVLNGMGLRTKLFFKIYVAGLYLPAKESDPAKILAADRPRQLVMHFLYKEVEKKKLVEAWNEGFKKNSPSSLAAVQARLEKFNALWPDMKSGDRAVLTYFPGVGTKVEILGKEVGTIEGKDFADALFSVWLGPEPPNGDLKKGLLGQ